MPFESVKNKPMADIAFRGNNGIVVIIERLETANAVRVSKKTRRWSVLLYWTTRYIKKITLRVFKQQHSTPNGFPLNVLKFAVGELTDLQVCSDEIL